MVAIGKGIAFPATTSQPFPESNPKENVDLLKADEASVHNVKCI